MKLNSTWRIWIFSSLAAGSVIAVLDPAGISLQSWLAFVAVSAIGVGVLQLAVQLLGVSSKDRGVLGVLAAAVVLRLAVALILTYVLPAFGYEETVQQAGYVFYDAYMRDQAAWDLGSSTRPLWIAIAEGEPSDQYGTLLFVSSMVYRYLSPSAHHPLLVASLGAWLGSLAVLFTWKAVQMTIDSRGAIFAAWVVALYPDGVLLSASQMREPYLISGFAASLLGYAFLRSGRIRAGVTAFLAAMALMLVSPPFALLSLVVVGFAWIWEGRKHPKQTGWLLIGLGILAGAAFLLTIMAWTGAGVVEGTGLEAVREWMIRGAEFQSHQLERGSGWVQKMFRQAPEWAHLPMATVYGLILPFFPAGLMSEGALVWRIIVTWRGLGWMLLITFLLYAPLAAIKAEGLRSLHTYLALAVWVVALLVSFRAAGDLWDNPRYRTVLLAAQASVAAWAWVNAQRKLSPWLLRTALLVAYFNMMFLVWYAGRAGIMPPLYFEKMMPILGVSIGLFLVGSFALDWVRQRRLTR